MVIVVGRVQYLGGFLPWLAFTRLTPVRGSTTHIHRVNYHIITCLSHAQGRKEKNRHTRTPLLLEAGRLFLARLLHDAFLLFTYHHIQYMEGRFFFIFVQCPPPRFGWRMMRFYHTQYHI